MTTPTEGQPIGPGKWTVDGLLALREQDRLEINRLFFAAQYARFMMGVDNDEARLALMEACAQTTVRERPDDR